MEFIKMHGLGNDYIYFDCTSGKNMRDDWDKIAIKVSDRHFGIGSDGIILICDSDVADFKMKIYNVDGSEAEMCGNGIRCVGKYVYDNGLTNKEKLSIETLAGIKYLELNVIDNIVDTVKVDMGEPIFGKEKIPAMCDDNNHIVIDVLDKKFDVTCVSMGNPHAVIEVSDVDSFDVSKYGSILESDKHFPKRTNVEFVQIIDRKHVKMRVYERGVGETFACGTGSCGTAVACYLNQKVDREIKVELLGGILNINYADDNHVYMTGKAVTVFKGNVDI